MENRIEEFTKLAEAGKGCALRDQLMKMDFVESRETMRQIGLQNDEHRKSDEHVPAIVFFGNGLANYQDFLNSKTLFREKVDPSTARRLPECSEFETK